MPFLPAIASFAGSGFLNAFAGPFFGMAHDVVNASMLPTKQGALSKLRNTLPGPDAMFTAYQRGLVTRTGLDHGLALHNINTEIGWGDAVDGNRAKWWESVLRSQSPRMDLSQLVYAWFSGIIDDAQWNQLIKHYKFRGDQQQILFDFMYAKFDPPTILTNYFRGSDDKDKTIARLRKFHGCDLADATTILNNSQFIPPPGDLTLFAVRDVFNPDVRKRDNLEDEFSDNQEMAEWFAAQGIGDVTIKGKDGKSYTRNIPLDYWVAHWQLMAPGQAYEALHRLRPDRLGRYTDIIPGVKAFTIGDVRNLLKQADYAPKFRDTLAAISYSLPGIREVRQMFMTEIIDSPELNAKLQDRGYSPADAKEITDYYISVKKKKDDDDKDKRYTKVYSKLRTEVLAGYKLGSISRELATNYLLSTDMEPDEVNGLLDAIDIGANNDKVKAFIAMTKSAFMLGGYDGFQAFSSLNEIGVSGTRAASYVQVWQRQMTLPRKSLAAGKIVEYVADGRIPIAEARIRLENLGYRDPDSQLLLLEAYDKAQEKALKLQIQEQKNEEKAASAAEKLAAKAQAENRRKIADFAKIVTLPRMTAWYKLGLVDKQWIYDNLIYIGWPMAEALLAIEAIPDRSPDNA